jgi:twitching motility two-component system response regulator PilG
MASSGAKRICLVDDEPDFVELLASLLTMNGFQVEKINDPKLAWQRLQVEAFDVVILDAMMPGMDGLTLAEKLRRTGAYARTPLFILSAKKLTDQERKFILTEDIHFVAKPFTTRRLLDVIAASLAKP